MVYLLWIIAIIIITATLKITIQYFGHSDLTGTIVRYVAMTKQIILAIIRYDTGNKTKSLKVALIARKTKRQ